MKSFFRMVSLSLLKQLKRDYRRFVLKYVIDETQDEEVPNTVNQPIQILTTDLPADKEIIITFVQQLKEEYKQEFIRTIAQQLEQKGL